MARKITREILESYLQCKNKAHLQLAGEQGTKCDYELMQAEARNRVRLKGTNKLLAKHKAVGVLQDIALTIRAVKQGRPLLVDATLADERLSIKFDGLQKETGPSRLGNFHYVPVLFHETERPGKLQKDLLELHGLIIGHFQRTQPSTGILIYGQACNFTTIKLRSNNAIGRRTIQELSAIQAVDTPPKLVLNRHCQICEFRQSCRAEATAKDNLSLLRNMSEKESRKHNKRGIFTIMQLSCTFRAPKRRKRPDRKSPPHQPALQALAVREKKIYLLGAPELPSSPTRVYFDIEGDPERRFVYLLGMIIERNGAEDRRSFWIDRPIEEFQLFDQFINVVNSLDDYYLYSFGAYEAIFLRRMIKRSGRQELAENILPRLVNVLAIIYSHVYFPTYTNALKDIGDYLGFKWTETEASGIQSIVWRRHWEATGASVFKEMLTTYNMEDCSALKMVTECLYAICPACLPATQPQAIANDGHQVSRIEESESQWSRREWCRAKFAFPDFDFINKRAYFDYQRDRVFIRTSKSLTRRIHRRHSRRKNKHPRANRSVEISVKECPLCGATELIRRSDGRLTRSVFDLRITPSGIKRWVTRFISAWHWCVGCGQRFLPREYLRLDDHGHSSWALYEHVAHRASYSSIAETFRDCFGFSVFAGDVRTFKFLLSRYYDTTYQQLLEKIVAGKIIHVDETEVHVTRIGKGYVWVFTNLEEVFFVYRQSREGRFLSDMLKDFRGVLISDFYAAYDSLPCEQQKCLIHLMRDLNHDLKSNPWDEELKSLAANFGSLLRKIIATVDKYGLRHRHLGKHRRKSAQFFRTVLRERYQSEIAEAYRNRLLKYQHKLFTFLNHDGVPWNNNNAEHALKKFADYREMVDGQFSEAGLKEYLVLLSIYLTCRYKKISFLRFLLSEEKNIDAFRQSRKLRTVLPTIELCPEGFVFSRRRNREPDWDQKRERKRL
jgi:predicted RecB family nuclease